MTTGTKIRLLDHGDAAAFWKLRLEALESEPRSFGESPEEHRQSNLESSLERLMGNPEESFVFGAFHEQQLVGVAGFFRYDLAKARHKGRIWGVYVRRDFRRQGIARSLLTALLERLRTLAGLEQVTLVVAGGQHAANSLYRSLGFKSYGVEPRALKVGDDYLDSEYMILRLR